jgi:putative peptidoglycan lipid II flippase
VAEPPSAAGSGPSESDQPEPLRVPIPAGPDGMESASDDQWTSSAEDTQATNGGEQAAAPAQSELMARGALMAVGTIVSRITGLARDVAMTAAIGLGVIADIFTVGNTIPNTVYVLTVGGAMNAVFVPQLVRRMRGDSDGGVGFVDRLLTLTIVALVLLTGLSLLLAPFLTRIYASPSYSEQEMQLAVAFTRFCLPQVFFYGLFTLLSQVLNARGRFSPPMYAPIANNIVAIAVFLGFLAIAGPTAAQGDTLTSAQTAWLGIGSTIAVATQALLLIPFLWSSGYRWRPRFDWRGWGLSRTGSLALWTLGLLAANQVSFIVHSRLATTANVLAQQEGLPAAGITTYQKAYQIFFLPHSIVTVSLVTALLPGLSRLAHARQLDTVSATLTKTIRTVTALVVPITAALVPLAPLVAAALFGYGASGTDAAQQIGYTTIGMLVGLVPFSIYFILLRGWYSLEDTRTPFFLSLALNAINVVLSIGLFYAVPTQWKVPAIGLAFGLTYWAMMLVAWPVLARRLGGIATTSTWMAVARMLLAGAVGSAATLGVLWLGQALLPGVWDSLIQKVLLLAVAGLAALLAYLVAARLLRVSEVSTAMGIVRRRLGR